MTKAFPPAFQPKPPKVLLGGFPPLSALLRTGPRRRRVGVLGRRTSSRQHGRQLLVGVLRPGSSVLDVRPLGVEGPDSRHRGGEHGLEWGHDEVTGGVEPLGEGAGEVDGAGRAGLGGDGDVEVVDGDVLLGVGCYRNLFYQGIV